MGNNKSDIVLCDHDLNSKNSNLIIFKKRSMIHPEQIDCFCPICKKTFRFIKNYDNLWKLLENNEID